MPTPLPEVSYKVASKLGVKGYCASDFPRDQFISALREQIGFGTVNITSLEDQSTLCTARRQLSTVETDVKKVKVSYDVLLVVEAERDTVKNVVDDFSDTSGASTALADFSNKFVSEITGSGLTVAADFDVPAAEAEAATSIEVSQAPTAAPTNVPTPLPTEVSYVSSSSDGTIGAVEIVGIIVALIVAITVATWISKTSKKKKEPAKVYDADAVKAIPPANPTKSSSAASNKAQQVFPGPDSPPPEDATRASPVYPGAYEETKEEEKEEEAVAAGGKDQLVLAVAAGEKDQLVLQGSPVLEEDKRAEPLVMSPLATRGPPVDLFIDGIGGLTDSSDDDEEGLPQLSLGLSPSQQLQ